MKITNNQDQLKVALYLRVSTDDQVEKFGLDLQKTSLTGLLQSKGTLEDGRPKMVLAGDKYIYIDEGISGTTPLDERPAFSQLKEDILFAAEGQKPFDVVAVYKIDRFARRLKILLEVIEYFEESDIQFLSANESIDTSTPFGKAILGIVGIIAELEIETTKARTQAGRAEAIKNGVIMGSNAIFGYRKDADKKLVVLQEEAETVNLIFDMFANQKQSTQYIADYLADQQIPSPDASAVKHQKRSGEIKKKNNMYFWRSEQVRDILANEAYIGKYYYGKTKKSKSIPKEEWQLSPYQHKSIIDIYLFKQAQDLLKQSKQLANTINKTADGHIYLLSGLLKCEACYRSDGADIAPINWVGDRKKIQTKGHSIKYTYAYKCGRKNTKKSQIICGTIPLPAEPIEQYVVEITKRLLSNPVATYNYQRKLDSSRLEIKNLKKRREDIKKMLNSLPARRERLKEQHESSIIDLASLKSKTNDLTSKEQTWKKELESVEYKIAQNSLSAGYISTLKLFSPKYQQALNDIYTNRQEIFDILHMLISSITVFSRPMDENDKVAGRKKENQQIPYRLEIELKLPRDILNDFASRFGVISSNL
jgi:site-specific DNA recombinase